MGSSFVDFYRLFFSFLVFFSIIFLVVLVTTKGKIEKYPSFYNLSKTIFLVFGVLSVFAVFQLGSDLYYIFEDEINSANDFILTSLKSFFSDIFSW